MMRGFLVFIFFVWGAFASLPAEEMSSSVRKMVHKSIEEILSYHVEYKDFSSLLAKRSLKLFFEQFDPYRMYLLHSEVHSFWNMPEKNLQDVVRAHHRGEYFVYERADYVIISSILRARRLREQAKNQILQEQDWNWEARDASSVFPKTEEALLQSIKRQMLGVLYSEKREEGRQEISRQEVEKVLFLFEKKLQAAEEFYLAKDKGNALAMHLLKAFAKSLDAHTAFFTPEEAADLRMNLEKQFEGVGLVLREGMRGIVVKEVLVGGPAEKSGKIFEGDVFISVNGKNVNEASYQEVLSWLKGDKGRKVVLELQDKEGKIKTVSLVREKIVMIDERVQYASYPYGDGIIGVIELPGFYENSDGVSAEKDMKEALRSLKSQGQLHGLVIDMRNNSGGFLSQAVKVSGLFMSGGVVVISKYSHGQMQYLREVDGRIYYEGPLVLLTSKMSASAAEILAQALQDYGIALVVGDERTYGKGTIQYQTVTDGKSEAFFKVTVGKYYTVSGRSTQIEGVKADLVVPTAYAPFNIGEKYLPYPLKNDQVSPAFVDPLSDVDARSRSWMQKNYLPNLQKKLSIWTEMCSLLKSNSKYRMENNKDFLCFLRWLQGEASLREESSFGLEDLQLNEALEIVKDMSLLSKYKKKQF